MSRGSYNGDPSVFVEKITTYLKQVHVEYLKMLMPGSTDEFIKSKTYTVMVLFNSLCAEDATFVGDWATAASQDLAPVPPDTADISYGRLDCALFPEECARWSSTTPAAVFHKKVNGKYAKVTKFTSSNLANAVQSARTELDGVSTGTDLPAAVSENPTNPEVPSSDGYDVIKNENLETRSLADVKDLYSQYKSMFTGEAWTGEMNDLGTCTVGESNADDRVQATLNVNIVRELAGVDPVVLDDEKYLTGCQRTALVLHKIGYITHYPNVDRTDVCVEGNKAVVAEYAEKSNLAQNCESATKYIGLFMEDLGEENEQAVGHRRWILNPNVKDIGFGLAPQKSYRRGQTTGGIEINDARPSIVVMRIVTPGDEAYDKVKFISWPSAGPFPSEQVPPIWHVSCDIFRDTSITKDDIKIKVTREDNQDIPVTSHFFNRQYMGTPDALLMKMDENVKELCSAGHTVHVEIWVTNKNKKLDYTFTLFDLSTEVKLCLYNTNEEACPADTQNYRYAQGQLGNIAESITNSKAERAVINVSESVTGDIDLSSLENVHVLISGKTIDGLITVSASSVIEIADPSKTTVKLSWDVTTGKAGMLTTPTQPKQLQVNVPTIASGREAEYSRVDVYKGKMTPVQFTGDNFAGEIQDYDAGYLFFGAYVNGSTIGVSLSYVKLILVLRSGTCDSSATEEMVNAQVIDVKQNGLGGSLDKTKLVRWYICDASVNRIEPSYFPSDRYQDYEIITAVRMGTSRTVTLIYDPVMEKTVRSLTMKDFETNGANTNIFDIQTADNTWIVRHKALTIGYNEVKNDSTSSWGTPTFVSIPDLTDASSEKAKTCLKQTTLQPYTDQDTDRCAFDTSYNAQRCEFDPMNGDDSSILWYRFETSGVNERVVSRLIGYDYDYFADKGGVRPHQFIPKTGKESKAIHLRAEGGLTRPTTPGEEQGPYLVPYVDLDPSYDKPVIPMVVENYQDITLEVNGDMLNNITYFNVGKVTLDLGSKKEFDEIAVTEPGSWTSYLSSVAGIAIKSLKVSSDATVQAEKAEATNLVTDKASCKLTGISVTDTWDLSDSFVTLSGAKVTSKVKVKRNSRFPQIIVEDGAATTFNPSSIEYDMGFTSSSKLLDLVEETTTLVTGITKNTCDSLVGKVTLTNAPQFQAKCADDGSLQITRTIENGANQDIDTVVTLPPAQEITETTEWQSTSEIPENIKVESEVSLSMVGGLNFEVTRIEVGSTGKVTAKNMAVTTELDMAGGASLSAAEGSKITITNRQTNVKFTVKDGQAPTLDLGMIGDYSAVPAAVSVTVDEKIKGTTSIIKGRTLNCEDWLSVVQASGSRAGDVSFRCEKTQSSQAHLLADVLEEWAVMMDSQAGGLPGGAIAGIVIAVLVIAGVAVALTIFFIRKRKLQKFDRDIDLQV